MLVEARSLSKFDLSAATATAARAGATVVAAAWQIGPAPDDTQFEADYVHPHTIVVSATSRSGYSGLSLLSGHAPRGARGRWNTAPDAKLRPLPQREGVVLHGQRL